MDKQTTGTEEHIINENAGDQEISDIEQDAATKEAAVESDKAIKTEDGTESFSEMYEESLKSLQEGELVRGEIVKVNKEYVLVDIGYKSEGQIPLKEFLDDEGNVTAHVGEQVDVLLERREDDEGIISLSILFGSTPMTF